MVTAALKCASERLPATYASHDDARFQILKSLNWFEAHDEYEWPDFTSFNYDFSQAMRLRRALVQDIFNALEKAGNLKISVPGTPDSNTGRRAGIRSLCFHFVGQICIADNLQAVPTIASGSASERPRLTPCLRLQMENMAPSSLKS